MPAALAAMDTLSLLTSWHPSRSPIEALPFNWWLGGQSLGVGTTRTRPDQRERRSADGHPVLLQPAGCTGGLLGNRHRTQPYSAILYPLQGSGTGYQRRGMPLYHGCGGQSEEGSVRRQASRTQPVDEACPTIVDIAAPERILDRARCTEVVAPRRDRTWRVLDGGCG